MQLDTVKIKADVTADNPHGHITINASDFDQSKHELLDGESLPVAVQGGASTNLPSMAELVEARDNLLARREDLDRLEQALDRREHELAEREQAVLAREQAAQAEAERLAAEKQAVEKTGADKASSKKSTAAGDGEKK